MKLNKKKVLFVSLAVALVAILSFGTLAWFNDTASLTNKFMVDTSDAGDDYNPFNVGIFETNETGTKDWDGLEYDDILPGQIIHKDPTVINECAYDQLVRVCVTFDNAKGWKKLVGTYGEKVAPNTTYTVDSTKWQFTSIVDRAEEDDTITYVYYLKDVLSKKSDAGYDRETLFTSVTIPCEFTEKDMKDNLNNGNFKITVKADALQADHLGIEGFDATKEDAVQNAFVNVAQWEAMTAYDYK